MGIKLSGDTVHFEDIFRASRGLRLVFCISCTMSQHARGIILISSAIKSQSIAESDSMEVMKRFDTALTY